MLGQAHDIIEEGTPNPRDEKTGWVSWSDQEVSNIYKIGETTNLIQENI